MNVQQKAACAELSISVIAMLTAVAAYPWLGQGAMGMFGLLGLLGLLPLLYRKKGNEVVTDERDQMISRRATVFGFGAGWLILYMSVFLLSCVIGSHEASVPKNALVLALYVSIAMVFAVKGAASLILYRTKQHAA